MADSYKPPFTDWYIKQNVTPPSTTPHGTEESIRENLKPVKTWNWKLRGNQLECDTDQGKLVQSIPTGYVCHGDDADGNPILRKIEV